MQALPRVGLKTLLQLWSAQIGRAALKLRSPMSNSQAIVVGHNVHQFLPTESPIEPCAFGLMQLIALTYPSEAVVSIQMVKPANEILAYIKPFCQKTMK